MINTINVKTTDLANSEFPEPASIKKEVTSTTGKRSAVSQIPSSSCGDSGKATLPDNWKQLQVDPIADIPPQIRRVQCDTAYSSEATNPLRVDIKDLPPVSKGYRGIDQQEKRNLELNMWLNGYRTLGKLSDFDCAKIPLKPLRHRETSLMSTLRTNPINHGFNLNELTDKQRQKIDTLYQQKNCFVRYCKINDDDSQWLKPGTLLIDRIPIGLYSGLDSTGITCTLPFDKEIVFTSKKDASTNVIFLHEDIKGLKIPFHEFIGYQSNLPAKIKELHERTCTPIYKKTTSAKLFIENRKVRFSKPKRKLLGYKTPLAHNEALHLPFKPSDVQSILLTREELFFMFNTVLRLKSNFEQMHELDELPITIYDVKSGERSHYFLSQLLTNAQTEQIKIKMELFQKQLKAHSVIPAIEKGFLNAFKGLTNREYIQFVVNLPDELLNIEPKGKEEVKQLMEDSRWIFNWQGFLDLILAGNNIYFFSGNRNDLIVGAFVDLYKRYKNQMTNEAEILAQKLYYILIYYLPDDSHHFFDSICSISELPDELQLITYRIKPFWIDKRIYSDHTRFGYDLIWLMKGGSDLQSYIIHMLFHRHKDNFNFFKEIIFKIHDYSRPSRLASGLDSFFDLTSPEISRFIYEYFIYHPFEKLKPIFTTLFTECLSRATNRANIDTCIRIGVPSSIFSQSINSNNLFRIDRKAVKEAVNILCERLENVWKEYRQSHDFKLMAKQVKKTCSNIPQLPEYLRDMKLPLAKGSNPPKIFEYLKQPLLKPLQIPDVYNHHQAIRLILDRYYRCSGANKLVNLHALVNSRTTTPECGHALRASINLRLLMQLLETEGLAELTNQQKMLLEYAAIYENSASEDVSKDQEVSVSAGYFQRDMSHNCHDLYATDIHAIAKAMANKEDDIFDDSIAPQQRLYRRLLRFANRLDFNRYQSVPEGFPDFERKPVHPDEVDPSSLGIDPNWLTTKQFKNKLFAGINGLFDLAAVSGGARLDNRSQKAYVRNYKLNPKSSDHLDHFFEYSSAPLEALEKLLDDNIRRNIAKRAGINTCDDDEHIICYREQETIELGYTRFIHNSYHDLAQVPLPEMKLWEKLCLEHAPELLNPALQNSIDQAVSRLNNGIKRNIGNISQESLQHPLAQTFLRDMHSLAVMPEHRLREVVSTNTADAAKSHRNETVYTLKPKT